ncbi:MAG: peptide ABC transporter substrate-binding protein [Chloroflexi bacterium]|nr:peptide ABC transporter substrate-binding protein [Chloroflexota bacterium]
MKLLFNQGPVILNVHLSAGAKDQDAARPIIEPLAEMGPDGRPIARLAVDVPTRANGGVSADNQTATWKLKPGLKWSDGTALTADDVVFTYQYMANTAVAATTFTNTGNVASVTATDPTTVVVRFKNPTANPYTWGVGVTSAIIQKAQFNAFNGANAKDAPGNQRPIGSGPYKVREFKPNDIIIYEINENYRDATKPFFKTVQIKTVADAGTAARAACQTGDADYGWSLNLPADQLKPFFATGRCDNIAAPGASVEFINFNFANPKIEGEGRAEPQNPHPFLTDKKVREALAMGINRQIIGGEIYGGVTGSATCNVLNQPPTLRSSATANMPACKYDLAAANKLLDEAGWVKGADGIRAKGGVKMEILYQTTVAAFRQQIQEVIKKDWTALGVKVELKAIPAGTFFSTDAGSNDTAAKFFADVQEAGNGYSDPDPEVYMAQYLTSEIKTRSAQWRGRNYARWSSPAYDALHAQLVKELDVAKRTELYIKMNDLLVSEVVTVPVASYLRPVSAKSKELKGPVANVWAGDLWNIHEWSK